MYIYGAEVCIGRFMLYVQVSDDEQECVCICISVDKVFIQKAFQRILKRAVCYQFLFSGTVVNNIAEMVLCQPAIYNPDVCYSWI